MFGDADCAPTFDSWVNCFRIFTFADGTRFSGQAFIKVLGQKKKTALSGSVWSLAGLKRFVTFEIFCILCQILSIALSADKSRQSFPLSCGVFMYVNISDRCTRELF